MHDVTGSNDPSSDASASVDAGPATGGVMDGFADGLAMKAFVTGCLSVALGLAGSLAAPSEACASDTTGAKTTTETAQTKAKTKPTRKSSKRPHAKPARARAAAALREPVPAPVVDPHTAAGAAWAPAGAVSAPAATNPAALLDVDEAKGKDGCQNHGDAQRPPECLERPKSELELLPEVLLENITDTPVLGAFVTPVTEGVTFETAEGLPSVTVLVKPTKITRGSGLVAVGKF